MKHAFRRLTALCLALAVALSMGFLVSAASPYSVKMQSNTVTFIQNGYAASTFKAKDNNMTIMVDKSGDTLVCFTTSAGKYIGVTLGKQSSITVSGGLSQLTLDKSFTGTVEIASGASVSTASVNSAKAKLKVSGKATTVKAASKDSVTGSGTVGTLKVNGKTTSTNGSSGSSSGSSTLRYTAKAITASSGDTLGDLESKLRSAVKVTNTAGTGVDGSIEWVRDEDTEVNKTGTYKFEFEPDNDRYKTLRGSVKVSVSGSSSSGSSSGDTLTTTKGSLKLTAKAITASKGDTLSDLEDKLESAVTVKTTGGSRVDGDFEWVLDGDTEVTKTGTYKFEFEPDNSRYDTVRTSIRIVVGGSSSSSSSKKLSYEADTIYADYGDSLSDLKRDLEDSVEVTDRDGDEVDGTFKWVKSGSTKVKKDGSYQFKFEPDSSRYNTLTGSVKIEVDSSDGDGELKVTIKDIEVSRDDYTLSELKSKLKNAVTVKDRDTGKKVSGEFTWDDSSRTVVDSSGYFGFTFDPDSSKYDDVSDEVYIHVR